VGGRNEPSREHGLSDGKSVNPVGLVGWALEELVHVVALGWERERASASVLAAKAHTVYLLSREDHALNQHFRGKVRAELTPHLSADRVRDVKIDDQAEFESVLLETARLIVKHKAQGHRVYLHMAAGSKIAAAAMTLAGMYHAEALGGIYYARMKKLTVLQKENAYAAFERDGLTSDFQDIVQLPRFQLHRPREAAGFVLAHLYEKGPCSMRTIMKAMAGAEVKPFDSYPHLPEPDAGEQPKDPDQVWDARFRRGPLKELLDMDLIQSVTGAGRLLRYDVKGDGTYHALLTGLVRALRTTEKPPAGRRAAIPSRARR
jgi:hypothetical protein